MTLLLYAAAGLFIVFGLRIGVVFATRRSLHIGLLLGSWCYLIGGMVAIHYLSWWPLLTGFGLAWVVRLCGGDPGYRE